MVVPVDDHGDIDLDFLAQHLGDKTRMVAVNHISNALGTVNPVREITALAHAKAVPVLIDGAQAAPHLPIDVQQIGCDFYAFSGHKVFGPTGIGALYVSHERYAEMRPYQGGGDMIKSVSFEGSVWNDPPHKFEAGTPDIAGAIGLAAALDYLEQVGRRRLAAYEHGSSHYAAERLAGAALRAADRHRQGPGRGDLLRGRRHPPARRGHGARPPGHRGARRPPLRPAGDGAFRGARHGAGLVRVLQHRGRGRQIDFRPHQTADMFRR